MNQNNLSQPMIVYVMDAYCGWCWGFADRLGEFEAANRHRIAFTAISGGLFVGPRAQAIASFPHIPDANARITQVTGAVFGDAYNRLLKDGSLVLNSDHAGAGLAVLRAHAPERAVYWAHAMQEAFYIHGASLSDPATIAAIAKDNGLDADAVMRDLESGAGAKMAQADFALARQLGVTSYPTLLLVKDGAVNQLPATGTALPVLNQALDALLA